MRVLRFQANPKAPSAWVPDFAALESGVMRPMTHGEAYELSTDHKAASTVAKAICKGDLVALDGETAKEAARMHGVRPSDVKPSPINKSAAKPAAAEI